LNDDDGLEFDNIKRDNSDILESAQEEATSAVEDTQSEVVIPRNQQSSPTGIQPRPVPAPGLSLKSQEISNPTTKDRLGIKTSSN